MNKIFSAVCIFGTDFVDSGTESLVLMLDITDAGNGQTRWQFLVFDSIAAGNTSIRNGF